MPVGYMKKGELAEGYVEVVDFPNKGRVRTEDGMVLVKDRKSVV